MSWKDKLKGLVIKDDETDENQEAVLSNEGKEAAVTGGQPVNTPIPNQQSPLTNIVGSVDASFRKELTNIISSNNPPGEDYFEFKQAFDGLAESGMSTQSKITTVFNMLQSRGLTPEGVLTSIDTVYLPALENEKIEFQNELNNHVETNVVGRKQKLSQIDGDIDEMNQKIESLQKQIQLLRDSQLQIKAEIQEAEIKTRSTQANFEATYEDMVSEITELKTAIQSVTTTA